MSLSELREMVMDREMLKSRTRLSDWTELKRVDLKSSHHKGKTLRGDSFHISLSSPHFAQSLIVLIFILSNFSSFFIFSRKHCYWLTIWKKFFTPWYQALCSDMKSGFALQEVERKGIRTICDCDNHLRKHKGNSHFLGIFLLNILEDNFPLLPVL